MPANVPSTSGFHKLLAGKETILYKKLTRAILILGSHIKALLLKWRRDYENTNYFLCDDFWCEPRSVNSGDNARAD
jgi:uncharacterized SAM-binding protein YcdF (DUF218 family)